MKSGRSHLCRVFELTESLSIEEKAELIEMLLGRQAGLKVVMGDNHLNRVNEQINMMNRDELSEVLKVIAERIASEGK